jgi:peptide/nickel transport system ATP-binding protein
MGDNIILAVRGLRVRLPGGTVDTLRGIDLEVHRGAVLGIAGEAGAGATTLLRALIGLLPGATVTGSMRLDDREIADARERQWRKIRGRDVAIVFRDPALALDPTLRIGPQVAEALGRRGRVGRAERLERTADLLHEVGLESDVATHFSHQLRVDDGRRAMLAAALAGQPSLLLVDQGPTSWCAEQQRAFVADVSRISAARQLAALVVSHQPLLLGPFATEIAVLCGGLIVEKAPPAVLVSSPRVPYTAALVRARPLEQPQPPVVTERPRATRTKTLSLFATPSRPRPVRPPTPVKPTLREHLLVGCSYSLRCPRAISDCAEDEPPVTEDGHGRSWACWNPEPATDPGDP